MKKVIFPVVFVLIIIAIIWGNTKQITPEVAISIAKEFVYEDKEKSGIINFDNPKLEEVVFETLPQIAYIGRKTDIAKKPLYKITFNTDQDGLLGPVVVYINKKGGKIIGMGYRF